MFTQTLLEDTSRIFRPEGAVTLADVAATANTELENTARRDTASAFRTLVTKLEVDLATVPATPAAVRALIGEVTPGALGVSPKRLANLRSLVVRAVERFGMRRRVVTKAVPITPAWAELLSLAEPKHYRHGLNRFAAYCSAMDIEPDNVSPQKLVGFHDALVAECFVKSPRGILKHTIALWNYCMRRIEGWPRVQLASPFTRDPDTFPLFAFPASFQADVDRWIARMIQFDPLDLAGPSRPLRPATVTSYSMLFRRFASALVRREVLPLERITGLATFFEGKHFEEGLRHFLRNRQETNADAHHIARKLVYVAQHYVCVPDAELVRLQAMVRRLDPQRPRGMTPRNRDRLEQFDNPDVIRKFLSFPAAEMKRALACKSPIRRAKATERALIISLLIHTGLRIMNLRSLRLDRNIRRVGKHVFIELNRSETKNEIDLTLDLPFETVELLSDFVTKHRPLIVKHEDPYLFPGIDGGPRSYGAMRVAIAEPFKRHAGIEVNPHLFRHAIAKIVVERNPEMYVAVSRRLGHKSINTTLSSYLGTETRAASRQINRILHQARDNPLLED